MVEQRGRGRGLGAARMGAARWWAAAMWLAAGCAAGASGQVEPLPPLPQPTVTESASSIPLPPPAPEPPQSSTSTALVAPAGWSPEQNEVIAAFEAGIEAFRGAGQSLSTMTVPALDLTHTPAADEADRKLLALRASQGQITTWPNGISLRASFDEVEVDGSRALIAGCFPDDARRLEASSGEVVDEAVGARFFRGEVRLVDGQWRYHGFQTERLVLGTSEC